MKNEVKIPQRFAFFFCNKPNKTKREGYGMLYIYTGYEKLSSPEETV